MKHRAIKNILVAGCKKNSVAPIAPVYFVIDTIFM